MPKVSSFNAVYFNFCREGLSVSLQLNVSATIAGQWGLPVSAPQHWGYRRKQPCLVFCGGCGNLNSGLLAFTVMLLPTELSAQPLRLSF